MKQFKTSNLLLAAMAVWSALTLHSCQIVELVIGGTTYYDTEITTKDNQLITGRIGGQRSSNLVSGSKTISIKTDEGRKKVKSENIQYMTLARKGHPEKQQTLVYTDCKMPYTKKGEQRFRTFKNWQVLNSVGDHLLITAYGHSYSLAKDGALLITYSRDEGIKYCIRRQNDDCPILFGRSISSRSYMRKQWQAYLSDDPVLCQKIANKEIDAFDFTTIAEQYNPTGK
ncbi:hypothetical protein [uncultured Bacteroides sp.]|jgi:hypothetical protein|uniref:hypothetical protein n=2 Tax=uncultured Bacteroides sp. TaxID=162156 RepID=UPI0025D62010|nr:hypothetical protein [uncultured Bacteroides sp.]